MDYTQDEAQMILQHKKDQFRVEIRKKKTDKLIQQKRLKLFERNQAKQDTDDIENGQQLESQSQEVQQQQQLADNLPTQKVNTTDVKVFQDIETNLIESMKKGDEKSTTQLLLKLASLVGVNPSPIDQVFQTGLPDIVIRNLETGSLMKQKIYSAAVLSNLTVSSKEQMQVLYDHNLIQALLNAIPQKNPELAEHAAWALNNVLIGNITPDNLLGIFNIHPTIIEDLCYYFTIQGDTFQKLNLIRTIIQLIFILSKVIFINKDLYSLCRICVPYFVWILDRYHPKGQISPPASRFNLVTNQDVSQVIPPEELIYCARTIAFLSNGDARVASDMTRSQVDRVMIRYLEPGLNISEAFLQTVVRILGQISSGNDHQTDQLLQKDIFTFLKRLVSHPNIQIRKEVIWTISNLSAANPRQIAVFLEKNMPQFLISHLKTETNEEIRKEILVALINPTDQATKEQISVLLAAGLLPILSENLSTDMQPSMITLILEGLENILNLSNSSDSSDLLPQDFFRSVEDCGILQKVQDIYYLKNSIPEIVCLAHRILTLTSKNP